LCESYGNAQHAWSPEDVPLRSAIVSSKYLPLHKSLLVWAGFYSLSFWAVQDYKTAIMHHQGINKFFWKRTLDIQSETQCFL